MNMQPILEVDGNVQRKERRKQRGGTGLFGRKKRRNTDKKQAVIKSNNMPTSTSKRSIPKNPDAIDFSKLPMSMARLKTVGTKPAVKRTEDKIVKITIKRRKY